MSETLEVEVVYALPDTQTRVRLSVAVGATVAEAIAQAALPASIDGFDLRTAPVGIFGRRVRPDHRLRAGDRIEIYRPLQVDPKAARRARVAHERRERR